MSEARDSCERPTRRGLAHPGQPARAVGTSTEPRRGLRRERRVSPVRLRVEAERSRVSLPRQGLGAAGGVVDHDVAHARQSLERRGDLIADADCRSAARAAAGEPDPRHPLLIANPGKPVAFDCSSRRPAAYSPGVGPANSRSHVGGRGAWKDPAAGPWSRTAGCWPRTR
jgi:hypothetical protein